MSGVAALPWRKTGTLDEGARSEENKSKQQLTTGLRHDDHPLLFFATAALRMRAAAVVRR